MRPTIVLLCGLVLSACGSGNTGDVDSFIQSIATELCDWEFRCCTDAEIKIQDGHKFSTESDCVPYRQLSLQDELYANVLAARQGRVRVDRSQAQACLAQMTSMSCNPMPNQPATMPSMQLDACATVFVGLTRVGQPCEFATECEKGAHCVVESSGPASGVCVPYQVEGQICNSSDDCDPTVSQLYCAQQDFRCRVRAQLGEKCAYTVDTAGGAALPLLLECDNTTGNVYCDPGSSTCKQLPGAGQACLFPPPPGVSASCDPDPKLNLVCRTSGTSSTGVCTGPATNGQDCTNLPCGVGLYCQGSTTGNTCVPLPTLNQDCSTSDKCASPYYCDLNQFPATCVQPAELGQSCQSTICDVTLFCDTSQASPICAAKLGDGSPCTSSLECVSNDCSPTTPRVCNPTPPGAVLCVGRM